MLTVSKKDLQTTDWKNMPMEDLAFGNALDCDFTLRLFDKVNDDLNKDGRPILYDSVLAPVLTDFGKMEFHGVKVDKKYLSILDKQLKQEVSTSKDKCLSLSPVPELNVKSVPDLVTVLFTTEGFDLTPTKWNKKSDLPSTDAKELQILLSKLEAQDERSFKEDKALEFIQALLVFRKREKQYQTYVTNIKKAIEFNSEFVNYPQYNFSVVVTGRLSCSNYALKVPEETTTKKGIVKLKNTIKYKGVGFHTLPRVDEDDSVNIRKLFIADEDYRFITADFNAAELRMLAYKSKDLNLIQAFKSGEDLHKYTASLIFEKPISQITKEERQIAKSVSFLIVYGGGPGKLAIQIKKSKVFAKKVFSSYFKAYPGVPIWIDETRKRIQRLGYAESIFGRKRHLLNVYSPDRKYIERALRQGVNFEIQSPVSDMLLTSTFRINRMIENTEVSLQTKANVHDSYEGQSKIHDLEKSLLIINKGMSDLSYYEKNFGIKFNVPFTIDIEVGSSFGDGTKVEFDGNKVINLNQLIGKNNNS